MLISNFEYIPLRLMRRFLFNDEMLSKYGKLIPGYRINQGQISPFPIVDHYWQYCFKAGIDPVKRVFLEIGIGVTNATGYEIIARGGHLSWGYEPFRKPDHLMDSRLLKLVCENHNCRPDQIKPGVKRIKLIEDIPDGEIDIILSHSVLEHVRDLSRMFLELRRLLKNDGCMIHIVDYRDHFFKYPFHFMQFSENIWNTFLNPGNLYRYRLHDHVKTIKDSGFSVKILDIEYDDKGYNNIRNYASDRFKQDEFGTESVIQAVLFIRKEI